MLYLKAANTEDREQELICLRPTSSYETMTPSWSSSTYVTD